MMWLLAICHGYSQDKEPTCLCYLEGDNSPAGLMGAHTHEKNGWMVSYNYSRVNMSGMQSGISPLSQDYVFNKYVMSESNMSMDMHMLMLMYGITDRLSAMLMTSYSVNGMSMNMIEVRYGGSVPEDVVKDSLRALGFIEKNDKWQRINDGGN